MTGPDSASITIERQPDDLLVFTLAGRLDPQSVSRIWPQALRELDAQPPARLLVDASIVTYCDGSGLGFLFECSLRARRGNFSIEIHGLRPDLRRLLDPHTPAQFDQLEPEPPRPNAIEHIGEAAVAVGRDFIAQIRFVGEFLAAAGRIIARPRRMRWKEIPLTIERAGADAVGIVMLLGFLFGLILAFSSAMPLKRYGGEIYVADLSALALTRVLGPILAAIILAGRTGSAFAAELGTMKVNSELDALRTMALDPVPFLVVPKVIGAVLVSPLLTILANLAGLAGTALVLLILGFPFAQFIAHVKGIIGPQDVFVGLTKTLFFGLLIGGVSCLRGLQAGSNASAVGVAATRAVVSSIILIIVAEGTFSIIIHYLKL